MGKWDGEKGSLALRQQAEATLQARSQPPDGVTGAESAERVLHELQVHQIELEMQNEELRRTQSELDAARARYFDLYDLAPVGYLTLDGADVIVLANLTAAELLGAPRAALVGQPLQRFIAKDEQDQYYLQRRRPHPSRGQRAYEMQMRRANGAHFWAQLVETTEADAAGQRRVVLYDISERRRNEADRERLMAAVEQSDETIVITDLKGDIQYVNPAFGRSTGYTRAEALGKNPRLLKSGRQPAAFYQELWAALTAGQTWKGVLENRRKDGRLYTEEASISPVLDRDENIVNYVAVKRDITQRLALETGMLNAQKMEAVGRLAGGVAHDFNNMLGVILSFSELALEGVPDGQPLHAHLQEVLKAANRAAELTRQLLAFARRQAVETVPVDLNGAVAALQNMLTRVVGDKTRLLWQPHADPAMIKADMGQLDQLLVNLCINARDAIDVKGTVTMTTANATLTGGDCQDQDGCQPGDYVVLTVADDGCGMDAATLAHIFEPFYSTKGQGVGTGLGLAMAHSMVTHVGGFLRVHSLPGKGSQFEVYFPKLA